MSVEVDTTQWSLPGPADMPRDTLKLQLEVYGETILLRGFEDDSVWVRTVSADAIANVFTQHLGFSSGLLPQEALWWNQGEAGLRWFQDAPDTGRLFPVCWTGTPTGWWPPTGQDCDCPRLRAPRRGGRRVPLPRKLPRLLLGHRRPGRAGLPHLRRRGRLDAPRPELRLQVGVYGHFAPVDWSQVFDGQEPESTLDSN